MSANISGAQRLLAARLDDLIARTERGELACGNFLSPEMPPSSKGLRESVESNRGLQCLADTRMRRG